jgi:hypothetical protein
LYQPGQKISHNADAPECQKGKPFPKTMPSAHAVTTITNLLDIPQRTKQPGCHRDRSAPREEDRGPFRDDDEASVEDNHNSSTVMFAAVPSMAAIARTPTDAAPASRPSSQGAAATSLSQGSSNHEAVADSAQKKQRLSLSILDVQPPPSLLPTAGEPGRQEEETGMAPLRTEEMTVSDVTAWLQEENLGDLVETFASEQICGISLGILKDVLEGEGVMKFCEFVASPSGLHIRSCGPRLRLAKALARPIAFLRAGFALGNRFASGLDGVTVGSLATV